MSMIHDKITVRLGFILGVVFIPENNKLMAEFTSRCSIKQVNHHCRCLSRRCLRVAVSCRLCHYVAVVFASPSLASSLLHLCYRLVRCRVPVSFRSSLLCRRCSSSCLSSSSQRHCALCRNVAVACSRCSVGVALSSSLVVLFIARCFRRSSHVAASWLTLSLVVVVSRPRLRRSLSLLLCDCRRCRRGDYYKACLDTTTVYLNGV